MSRQLTPEEKEIIRETERLGAELEASGKKDGKRAPKPWRSALIFAGTFILFVLIAFLIFSIFN